MAYLYLTTDRFEAETLIEDPEINKKPKHYYHNLRFKESEDLAKRIGFNPMCSVEITNRDASPKRLNIMAKELVKLGLCVATEFDGKVEKYLPSDMNERNLLCQ